MNSRKKIAIAASVAGVLGLAGIAGAAYADNYGWRHGGKHHGMESYGRHGHYGKRGHRRHMMRRMMERFDTNEDGKVTRAEVDTYRNELVAKHDADKNGQLTLQEFEGVWLDMMRQRMVRRFQHFDRDGDASISADEIDRRINRMFTRLDRNDDGEISREDRRRRGYGWRRDGDRPEKDGNKSE